MSSEFGGLGGIVEAFASAAMDPTRWNSAMESAAQASGSFGAIMIPLQGRLPLFPTSDPMRRAMEAYVGDGWIHRDERYRAGPALSRRGVADDFDFITPDEIARHPFYQEFLSPCTLRWFAGVKVASGDDIWVLSLQRTIRQGPFTPNELCRLAALSRNLSGAARLARAFGFARVEAALDAFETSGSAVAMIGRAGEVIRLNTSAERLLGAGLQIVHRRIVSASRDATAALDRALHALIWSRDAEALHPPIVLPRKEGRPILAYPSRLPSIASDGFSQCQGFVVFVDLEARPVARAGDLMRTFGLTPAEARLANRLLSGDSVEATADNLGIAYETARNLLKRVFQKTDTQRQGQLISVLARLSRPRPAPSK